VKESVVGPVVMEKEAFLVLLVPKENLEGEVCYCSVKKHLQISCSIGLQGLPGEKGDRGKVGHLGEKVKAT
jgi:hypothetical protein